MKKNKNILFVAIMLLLFVVLPYIITNSYHRHVLILILLYATLASAWNILGGFTGQISLANVLFFAIGAYTSSLLFVHFAISPWIGMVVGGILATLFSFFIGVPFFRLHGRYFLIATVALVPTAQALANRWELIGGARGILIPLAKDSLAILQFKSKLPYYFVILGILILTLIVVINIYNSKLGYCMRTIKMDQEAAESIGINSRKYKLIAIMISAFITAIAGSFYAQYIQYIDPVSIIRVDTSILMVLITAAGGIETIWGPVIGAAILIPLAEYTRSSLGGLGSGIDLVIYGFLIMIIVMYEPGGILAIVANFTRRKAGGEIGKDNS